MENTPKKFVLTVGEARIECEPSNIVMMTNKQTDGFPRTVTAILGTIESVDNESNIISVRFGDDRGNVATVSIADVSGAYVGRRCWIDILKLEVEFLD